MENKTKTIIISTAVASGVSIVGFLFNFYIFTPKNIQTEFEREAFKSLLVESSELYAEVNSFNNKTLSLFGNYGINSRDLDSLIAKYIKTIEQVKRLNAKLSSFGNNNQIEFSKAYLENLYQITSLISVHQMEVKNFEKLIRESSIKIEKQEKNSVLFKQTSEKLDFVIEKENELFFRLRDIKFPRLLNLSKINNHLYRKELGLEITNDIIEAYQQLEVLDSITTEFDYQRHQNEYLTARARHLINYKVDSGDSLVNQMVKFDLLGRIIIEQAQHVR